MTRLARTLIAVHAGAVVVFAAAPAPSAGAETHSFEGSCAIAGYAELDDPMTLVPTQSWFSYRGQGRCMGTLDGKVLPERGVPVGMTSEGPRAVHSCAVGLDPGITWQLTFDLERPQRDVSIHGFGDIVDVLRSQNSVFHGQRDGTAVAQNTIQGHAETLERCFAEGVNAGSVGIQIDTVTPLVSDERQAPESRTGGEPAPQTLRLSVRPREVRAGKRTRLRFVATSLQARRRSPVRGATIRLAGRSARTDRRGRASLVLRLRRLGSRRVTASAPGGATAVGTFRVVRSR